MRLWIPMIGDAFELEKDWTFSLHPEYRNFGLFKAEDPASVKGTRGIKSGSRAVTIPKGSELVCDRVYIRQGGDEYASITFVIKRHATSSEHFGCRFWAHLDDVNTIECAFTTSGNPIGPMAKSHYKMLALPDAEREKRQARAKRSKKNKVELDLARQGLLEELCRKDAGRNKDVHAHLMVLVDQITQDRNTANSSGRGGYNDINYVREHLTQGWNVHKVWGCSSTRADMKTGLTTRKFYVNEAVWSSGGYKRYKIPAFTVISEGAEIREIKATKV
jgi:hypothetical protein